MPANKNALIRYKTIDNCLRRRYRRWTLQDLIDACSDALYDMEGIRTGVSTRTIQNDLQVMRSDKLGYNAPIEVYDHKYYRYSDPDYSISNIPMSDNDLNIMQEAVDMLQQLSEFDEFAEMSDVVSRLQEKLAISRHGRKPVVSFDNVPDLKGLKLLNPLYQYIIRQQVVHIIYQPFSYKEPLQIDLCPHLLKEFRNRWFLFGSRADDLTIFNFALDRIISVEPVNDIEYRQNPNFNPEHFFDDVIGVSRNITDKPQRLVIWATPSESKYIMTKPFHKSQRLIHSHDDGCCEFEINVIVNYELYSVLLSYGPGIKVLSPDTVVQGMHERLKEAEIRYETKTDKAET